MTTLTEGTYQGDLIRWEEDNRYSREEVTIKSGADLEIGTVLGVFTSTGDVGKYKGHTPAAEDGTEDPVAVLITPAKAAGGDVKAVALVREAKVNRHALIHHSSVDTVGERNAVVAALAAVGIIAD